MDRGFIDLLIISAADLKRGWLPVADKKIAVAWVDPNQKERTKPAEGFNHVWNERLKLQLGDAGPSLTIEIRSKGAFVGDTLLGTVHIPVAEIAMDGHKEANRRSTYLVEQPCGKKHGSLTVIAKIVNSQSNAAYRPTTSPGIYSSYPPAQTNLPEKFNSYYPAQSNLPEKFNPHTPSQTNLPEKFSYYTPAQTNLPEKFSPYTPAQTNLPDNFSSYPSSQTYEASAPLVYPPVEDYRPGQYQAPQLYPPAESYYPSPYPPSQSAPDTMQPTYPAYEPDSNIPPSWRPSEYSYAASQYDCCRPTPCPPPAPHDYPVTQPPPTAPYYPPTQYPSPQYYSYSPKYPPLHEPNSYPYSCYN